jgi:hypothetical protein
LLQILLQILLQMLLQVLILWTVGCLCRFWQYINVHLSLSQVIWLKAKFLYKKLSNFYFMIDVFYDGPAWPKHLFSRAYCVLCTVLVFVVELKQRVYIFDIETSRYSSLIQEYLNFVC